MIMKYLVKMQCTDLGIIGSCPRLLCIGLLCAGHGHVLLVLLLQLLHVHLKSLQLLLDKLLLRLIGRLIARHQLAPLQLQLLR